MCLLSCVLLQWQPGIVIDYSTGENRLSDEAQATSEEETTTEAATEAVTEQSTTETSKDDKEYAFILNTNSMKIHRPTCSSVKDMADHNKLGSNDTIEELKAMGYTPCKRCLKGY